MSLEKVPTVFKCVTCGKAYSNYSSLRYHRETHSDKLHACKQCDMKFKGSATLYYHKQTAHARPGQFDCVQCEKKYKSRSALREHKRTVHTEPGQLECDKCGKICTNKQTLNDHKRWVHSERKFECPVCGQKTHPGNSSAHMQTHTGQPCECPVCGSIHPNPKALAEHKRSVHSEAKHRCEHCGKMFGKASALHRHVDTVHNEKREEYRCSQCPRMFQSRKGQEDHMRTAHSDTRFTCDPECGLQSATRSEYLEHLKTRHSKQHPASCKCVSIDVMLARQVALNLGNTLFVKADETVRCTDGDCDFTTSCARQMEAHKEQRHHASYQPVLRCNSCKMWFANPSNLRSHNADKHRGERRFKRDKCGRMTYPPGADDRSSLDSADKRQRYKCGDCGYTSNNKANFIGHLTSCEQGTAVEPTTEIEDIKMESPHATDYHSQQAATSHISSLFSAASSCP